MTQDALLLLGAAVVGGYMTRLATRLAPTFSEFPLKTFIASLLSGIVAFADVFPYSVGDQLRLVTLVAGPIYAFGPLLLITLARVRRYRLARLLMDLLYWTDDGRGALRRLLAQVALQRGDAQRALELIPPGNLLMTAQALALEEQWEKLAALEIPLVADNAFLGETARIEALLRLGRTWEAENAIARMRANWESTGKGPIGYRSLKLSEAMLAAERGDLDTIREMAGEQLPGVAAHRLLAIFARGAEQAGRTADAARLYGQAYGAAPEGMRERYARRVHDLGMELPEQVQSRTSGKPWVTYALAAALVVAFLGQLWLDANAGQFAALFRPLQASNLAAAFLLGLPFVPSDDAWWRYLTYMFVHGNPIHIGFNAWVLLDIGRAFEFRRGWENLLAAFVVSGASGALLTALMSSGQPLVLVGASGGVLGVAGALLADSLASRSPADRALSGSLLRWMGLIALISVAIPNVSLWAHAGGVAGGLLWGWLRQRLPTSKSLDALFAATALAVLLVALYRALLLATRLL
ncbi:MAG TPA: rhomboid family intramembrane serine protease [Trueperaceae bacterium]